MMKLSRRHVITTMAGSGAVMLCPALLNAANIDTEWADIATTEPLGQAQTLSVEDGPATIDISALAPGEVAVIARPSFDAEYSNTGGIQYIGVHRRTDAQIAFGEANDRPGTVQDPRYYVVNLVCTHRGKAIGITGDPAAPFACTDRGGRHASVYDASGFGVSGASEGELLSVPDYAITVSADGATLTLS